MMMVVGSWLRMAVNTGAEDSFVAIIQTVVMGFNMSRVFSVVGQVSRLEGAIEPPVVERCNNVEVRGFRLVDDGGPEADGLSRLALKTGCVSNAGGLTKVEDLGGLRDAGSV